MIAGHKKGKKQRQPYTAPDTARSKSFAKILIALSEGEVEGSEYGNINPRDIYLDGSPLVNEDGSSNYNVKWEFRSGSNDQTYIPALPVVESDTSVGFSLKSITPWVRSITNTDVDRIRVRLSWQSLVNNKSNGDRVGVTVDYAIDLSTDGGAFEEIQRHTVSDKSTSKYERSHSFDLPRSPAGWRVRVRRITPDQTTDMIQDAMVLEAFTEIVDAKMTYPNTALLYLEFSAEQFPQIPKVSVEMKGRIIRVPDNYDPSTRTYTGVWSGVWKWAYTNNPAWCALDMITSARFGLGERLTLDQVDKWSIYEIARWCDVMVPDGKGGVEPRHTLNVYLQTMQDAWRVLGDLTSVFNGVTYWNGQQLEIQSDLLRDADFVYSRANVIDGKFTYTAIPRKQKYSQALVKYSNPLNEYETDTVAVNDIKLTRRFGVVQSEVGAFGCVSAGEAQRKGKWALMTNYLDRSVVFKTGLDGYLPKLGRIIAVADNLIAGESIGGRVSSAISNKITLDREPRAVPGDRLTINLPSGISETRNVLSVDVMTVTVDALFSETVSPDAVWAIDAGDLAIQLYKVISIKQESESRFSIQGVQYDRNKFDYVDNGAALDDRPITRTPATEQAPPANPVIAQYDFVEQGLAVTNVRLEWDIAPNAVRYELQWRKDRMQWININPQSSTGFDIEGVYSGVYEFRVRAVNAIGIASTFVTSSALSVTGKVGAPPKLAYLNAKSLVFGIELKWGFPADGAKDTSRTELQYRVLGGAEMILGDFSYPTDTYTMIGLKAGVEFQFRGRLHDRTGNIGAWSEWFLGSSSADAGDILDYLTGQITESQLGQSLLAEIGSIGALGNQVGDLDAALSGAVGTLTQSQQQIQNGLDALQQQVDLLSSSDPYDPLVSYPIGSVVKFDDAIYKAIQVAPAGIEPSNETYWEKIGDYASVADMVQALAIQVQDATTRVDQLDGVVTPIATQLNSLRATSRALDDWSDISDVIREHDSTAEFNEEVTVRANQYEALSQRITQLRASIDDDISAQITLLEQTIATETQALSLRISAQEAALGTANSRITNTNTALASLDASTATSLNQLNTKYDNNTSAINSEAIARTNADSALSGRITTAQAKADKATSDLRLEETTRANQFGSLTTSVSTAQSTANGAKALAETNTQTIANVDGTLKAQTTLKVQTVGTGGRKVITGIGLVADGASGESTVLIQANRFGLISSLNGTQTTPFIVENGQTFINEAFIKDATLVNAIVRNRLISDAKAPDGVTPLVDINFLTGEFSLRSYVAGQGSTVVNNKGTRVFDAAGNIRVKIGDLT